MIEYARLKSLRIFEVYFCSSKLNFPRYALVRYFQCKEFFPLSVLKRIKTTIHINLSDYDFNAMAHKSFRYDVRKIEKTSHLYKIGNNNSIKELNEVIESYAVFAKKRNITKPNKSRVMALRQSNIAYTLCSVDDCISYHIYLRSKERVRLLYSWINKRSEDKVVVNGLNKIHTKNDIEYFKNEGLSIYDFGGYSSDRNNGIDQFKRKFGGTIVKEYSGICISL